MHFIDPGRRCSHVPTQYFDQAGVFCLQYAVRILFLPGCGRQQRPVFLRHHVLRNHGGNAEKMCFPMPWQPFSQVTDAKLCRIIPSFATGLTHLYYSLTTLQISTFCPNMTRNSTAASITEAAVVLGGTIKNYIPKSAYSFDFNGYICMATTNRNIFIEGIPVSEVSLRKGNCFFFAARSRRRSNAASTFVTSGYFSGIGFV